MAFCDPMNGAICNSEYILLRRKLGWQMDKDLKGY